MTDSTYMSSDPDLNTNNMILDHETSEEIKESRFTAEHHLDQVYHAIPDWVKRQFPNLSLADRITKGFEYQQKVWTDAYLGEVERHSNTKSFLEYIFNRYKLNYMNEYWNFLTLKESKKESETELSTKPTTSA